MAPRSSVDRSSSEGNKGAEAEVAKETAETKAAAAVALQLSNIKKAIPAEVFEKSLPKSLFYMLRDYAVWAGLVLGMKALCATTLWQQDLALWHKALISIVFWALTGLFMWCIFMIGHDCGHGTFSNYELVNDIIGHITHGSLLVPFYPWQLSHRRHHMYHNHVDKDYSHPWYTEEKLSRPKMTTARLVCENVLMRATFPFTGWHLYLFGMPDGSHYIPNAEDRLWNEDTPPEEFNKCYVSTGVVVAFLLIAFKVMGGTLADFGFYYFLPYCVFGWWIVTVTYLQHHSPNTAVYGDDEWKFVNAAFETVDRKYGFGIDDITHNITNGHVVHHLFFKNIPHYNLSKATAALKTYLQQHNLMHLYRFEESQDFMFRVFYYFVKYGFLETIDREKKHESAESSVMASEAANNNSKAPMNFAENTQEPAAAY